MRSLRLLLPLLLSGALGCARTPPTVAPAPASVAERAGLIDSESLTALLDQGPVHLLDVRSDLFTFLRGHLPSAQFLHTETLRASVAGVPGQLFDGRWYLPLFARLGLGDSVPVVVYSQGETGNIDATFAAYLLLAAGHPQVRVLDGGFGKWQLEDRSIVQEYAAVQPGTWPHAPSFDAEQVSLGELLELRRRPDVVVVDARPTEQFTGDAGSQMRRGHIPGAVSHPWASDLVRDGFGVVFRPTDALQAQYAAQGIVPARDIIVYCNSTTEASHVWWTLRVLLGYPRVRIYTGAWTEWAGRAELPVATGP